MINIQMAWSSEILRLKHLICPSGALQMTKYVFNLQVLVHHSLDQ